MSSWKFFAGLCVVVVLFVGWYAYQGWEVQQEQAANRYNGFDFAESAEGFWVTRIEVQGQPYDIPFYYHPRETEDVIVHEGILEILYGEKPRQVFIAIDPDAGSRPVVGGVEISRITGHRYNLLNIPTSSALTRPAETAVDVPVVNCENASLIPNDTVVIQFVHEPEADAIVRDEQCIIVFYSTPEDAVRVADRLAYMMLQIM